MIIDYINLIFKDIKARKFSSFLTFFAIGLGIVSIFVIVLVGQGFEQSIQKQFEQLGTNRLIISADGSTLTGNFKKGLTDTESKLVENKPYISEVFPYYFKTSQVKFANEYITRFVFGVPFNEDYFRDFNVEIAQGRFPKEDRFGMILGPSAAEDLFKKDIKVGSSVYIEDTKFKVIGILKSIGNPEDDKNIYVNIDTMRDVYDAGKELSFIYATVQEDYDVNLAATNLEIILENKLGDDTVQIQTLDQMIEQLNSILGIVQMTLGGIALVSLIVGAIGIINTMYVIVTEKTKDIGIMKSIGARNSDIFLLYIIQAGTFGLLGAIFGVIFGSLGALGFGAWAQGNGYTFLEIAVNPIMVISLLIFGFGIGALSGFLPAYRASKLIIVDTLRK